MKKKLGILILLLLVCGAGLFGWSIFRKNHGNSASVLYGNVDIREVAMAFRQSGRLIKMHAEEGDRVEEGMLLAELDDQPYRDALSMAEANVLKAEAERNKLKSGFRPQEVQAARDAVREAQAVFELRETDFKRQEQLTKTGDASKKALDAARSARDVAAANLSAAKEQLSLQEEGYRSEDILAAEAQWAAALAQASQAKTALADCRLYAPAKATVLSRILEPGSMAGSSVPVYSLSLRDPIYVRAYMNEPMLGKIRQGDMVEIRTDSSSKVYHGKIGFISPRAEFTPKSVETPELRTDLVYRMRITVSDADEALKQGMPVTIRVQ